MIVPAVKCVLKTFKESLQVLHPVVIDLLLPAEEVEVRDQVAEVEAADLILLPAEVAGSRSGGWRTAQINIYHNIKRPGYARSFSLNPLFSTLAPPVFFNPGYTAFHLLLRVLVPQIPDLVMGILQGFLLLF